MTLVYNIEGFKEDWIFTQGDTINMARSVLQNGIIYDMTGMQIDIHVRRLDGLLIKTMTSSGMSPEIIILINVFTIYCTGFTEIGALKYDVQITDGSDILTIGSGNIYVLKEFTK
jgi:hypothetical protein